MGCQTLTRSNLGFLGIVVSDYTKLTSINVARGLAAFSVFVYHYQVGAVLAKYTGIGAFNWIGFPGANYGVTLFFVISGFCIHGSEWRRLQRDPEAAFSLRSYAERRVRRIYPVYLFALLISCLLNGINGDWPSFTDLHVHIFLLHGFSQAYFNSINLVLWTISIEAFFYIIYPLWLKYRLQAGLLRAFVGGTLLSMACCALTAAYFYPYSLPSRWFFLNTWGGWLLGALRAETMETSPQFYRSWKWWGIGIIVGAFGLFAEVSDFYQGHWLILKFPVRIYLCAWPLAGLVLAEKNLCSSRGIIGKAVAFLSWIGLASYSVYLLHEPLITLRNLVQNQVPFVYFKMPFQIASFFVILGISWLSYRYLELRFMRPRNQMQVAPDVSPAPQ